MIISIILLLIIILIMIITSMITVAILKVTSMATKRLLQGLGFGCGPRVTSSRGSRLQTPKFRGLRFRV